MGEELRALLRIICVVALYAVAWVVGLLGFGAAMSDGITDPATGAPTKPYAEMFGFWALAFLLILAAGLLWIDPIVRGLMRGSTSARQVGIGALVLGAAICATTIWAFINIAEFPPEIERALTLPLLVGIGIGPALLLAATVRVVRLPQ